MKRINKLFLIAAAVLGISACQKDVPETTLAMISTEISVPAPGASVPLKFAASSSWTASVDQDWVSLSSESGDKGQAIGITATVAANSTYENRTAVVTFACDDKKTEIKLVQNMLTSFESEVVYEISADAQNIEFAMNSNVDYVFTISDEAKSWISEVNAKAAPSASSKVSAVKSNDQLFSREGAIAVKAGDAVYGMIVRQKPQFESLSTASAACLGRTMRICVEYEYQDFNEYQIVLGDGDTQVTLAINAASGADIASIPAGIYEVDATDTHAENTFSIKSLNHIESVYTTIVSNGQSIAVEDGAITIEKEGNVYTISAVLVDDKEYEHRYLYVGEIPVVEDKTVGAYISNIAYDGNYNTYFTTNAKKWGVTGYISKAKDSSARNLNYFSVYFYTDKDLSYGEIPVGTYTFAKDTTSSEVTYANGKSLYANLDLSYGSFYENNGEKGWSAMLGSVVTISKNDDGTYKFDFNLKLGYYDYNDENDYVLMDEEDCVFTLPSVRVACDGISADATAPVPDGSYEFVSNMNIQALYFGNKAVFEGLASPLSWPSDGSLILVADAYVNGVFTVNLPLVVARGWEYTNNFSRDGYCVTPLPDGIYEFSTEVKDNVIIPATYGGTSYTVINSYTGTACKISGGSITLSNNGGMITYNLKATNPKTSEVYTYTGSHVFSFQAIKDNSKSANRIVLAQ